MLNFWPFPEKPKINPILNGLQAKSIYAGTVDPAEIAKRRARNKMARQSRRINRR